MQDTQRYAVYFDWGGVIRSLHDDEMFDDIAQACGVPRGAVDAIWSHLGPQMTRGEISSAEFWRHFARKNLIELPGCYNNLFTRVYKERSRLNQPVVDLITMLKGAGYTTGLMSNTVPPHLDFFFQDPGWSRYDLFQPIIVSPRVMAKKGDEGHHIYRIAEEMVPQKTIFFADDSKKYALDITEELNARPDAVKRWIGIWTPDFSRVAPTIEEALRKEGLRF